MVRKKSLFGDANKTKTSQECEWNRSCQRFCTCSQPGYQQFRRKGLNDLGEKAGECLFLLQQAKDKRGRLGWVMAHHCALYVRGLPGQPSGGLVVAAVGRHAQRPPLCPSACSPGGQAATITLSQSLQFTPRLSLG